MKPILLALSTADDRPRRHYESILASICISAWQQKDDVGERWFSDEELRSVLVYGSTDMRTHILWRVGQWKNIEEKLVLLREVWPLQLAARSSAVTGRLCTIAFDDEANFPALVEAILPLVSPYDGSSFMLPVQGDGNGNIFDRYPVHVLTLLSVILPLEVSKWPYGTDAALERLRKTSKSISKDPRMVELRRRLIRSR